jgi:hypothetical protein
MKTPEEIAQWVINNRYPKSENEKVSDLEMYHQLVTNIKKLSPQETLNCSSCKHVQCSIYVEPCDSCDGHSNYKPK